MNEMILEPLSVRQHWRMITAQDTWEALLVNYLEALARRCSQAGPCVIGHIKALAVFPENAFVQVSAVSPLIPASIKGSVPSGTETLNITLNVLVYGLPRAQLEQITRETAAFLAEKWQAEVTIDPIRDQPDSAHSTHSHTG